MTGVPPHPPAVVLAAGLLPSWLDAAAAPEQVAARLADVLDGQALWDPHQDGNPLTPRTLEAVPAELPSWRPPDTGLLDAHAAVIQQTWQEAVERFSPAMARVQVAGLDDLSGVRGLAAIPDLMVVGSLPARGGRFTWQVPPRVWIAGPRAPAWQRVVTAAGWYLLDPDAPDLLILDAATSEEELAGLPRCGAVIATGAGAAIDLLELAHRAVPRASVLAGVPGDFETWWDPVLHQGLHHNLPLDCALAWLVPDAVVAGVGRALTLTATPSESHAEPVDLDLGPAEAAAAPPPERAEAVTDRRRLIAALRDGDRELRTLLPAQRELTLALRIAVPRRGEVAGDAPFPHPDTDQAVVTLDVEARSEVWPVPQRGQLSLRLDQPDEPSTATGWRLTTPASGSTLLVAIDVSYAGRLLQRATLTAAVRDFALPGDKVRLAVQQTSAGPSPAGVGIASDVLLDATASDVFRWRSDGARVSLAGLDDLLDKIELSASRVLGRDRPPAGLDEPDARALLIDLARTGADLRDLLDPLELGSAPVVTLIVEEGSRILPLELVYDAEPPAASARLCRHAAHPPPPGTPCDLADRRVVCPYAFWGTTRTIIRDVLLGPGIDRVPPRRLRLTPALYGATSMADRGSDAAVLPSAVLQGAAAELFGPVQRATSWSDWRERVRSVRPELLVLLAHTEIAGSEAVIQISRSAKGWPSVLRRPDIRPELLGRPGDPPPLVLLVSCASAVINDRSGSLAGTLTSRGAAAVVGLLAKLSGAHGARVGVALLEALHDGRGVDLATALTAARRRLLADGLLIGLLVVAHGQIDVGLE